jgi:outer membrane immunogenic protein
MKNQLLSSVAVVTVAFGGSAVTTPAAAQQPVNWTGWYLGGHAGGGEAEFKTNSHRGRPFIETNPSGFVGGVHGGYNWQMNAFVFGLEGDIDGLSWHEKRFFDTAPRFIEDKVRLLASLRGRVGIAFDSFLIYFTGGLGYTSAKYLAVSPGGTENQPDDKIKKWRGVLGGGAEWKFHPNWSVRAEALWYSVDAVRIFGTDHLWQHEFKNARQVRGGLTFHF